ncbi:Ppx/GppA family phosphatase [Streptomyces sp. NPDC059861]|uniref:Ppx/GppA phosphatase family protein n=1 Tax=Streptomyces sp. NPDC059861 TaxID=3346974 RepID=UPI0036606BFB
MRVSVVDAGSNTVRLVVADSEGGLPLPVHTMKWKLRLSQQMEPDGSLADSAVNQLIEAVAAARDAAQSWSAAAPRSFATAVVRDATNRADILRAVLARTGVPLRTLPGELEAELTFLAARRWMGWRAGSLAVLDIGGGSLEVAFGRGRLPGFAVSLPLGAHHLTDKHLGTGDPPTPADLKALRRKVRHELRDVAARIRWENPAAVAVTSRTFQQLARLCGAAPGRQGVFVHRSMDRADLRAAIDTLAALPAAERAQLPGISRPRARQSLAGAVIGHTAMKLMGLRTVTVCPWALREGVLLRCIEDGPDWWDTLHVAGTATAATGSLHLA